RPVATIGLSPRRTPLLFMSHLLPRTQMRARLGVGARHALGQKSEPNLVRSNELGLDARTSGAHSGLDETGIEGRDDRLDSVADAELAEDAREVGLDRRRAEEELGAELGVRQSGREQREDLQLALGQRFESGWRAFVAARQRRGEAFEQPP